MGRPLGFVFLYFQLGSLEKRDVSLKIKNNKYHRQWDGAGFPVAYRELAAQWDEPAIARLQVAPLQVVFQLLSEE